MSYQVLARKWRPQNFKQMVGQEHVLQALIHALESQRLHHAYLFTGTRGVGKTTIGRILAKCLSCDKGITSEPCGTCGACETIKDGRYVDLIEIDAASRTKVEDMRELLDNVQYAPAEGRFKIYLIDEVHMLSQSSFNALLKTLEEPPEHVKFLFATTDPQKLPVTILSRCLQFNLKNMSPERIVGHLQHVLTDEQIKFEDMALWALARAADGSMRDALSLTDQAIAYGNNVLSEENVTVMLGTVDQKKIYRILDCLVNHNAAGLLTEVHALAEFSPDYPSVLATLSEILHRVAIEQAVPGAADNSMGDQEQVVKYASQLCAEDVQLFYQIALVSRQDLAITPDPKTGLEMALLRMIAFQLSPAPDENKPTLGNEAPVIPTSPESDTKKKTGLVEAEPAEPLAQLEEKVKEAESVVPDAIQSQVVDSSIESSELDVTSQVIAEVPDFGVEQASSTIMAEAPISAPVTDKASNQSLSQSSEPISPFVSTQQQGDNVKTETVSSDDSWNQQVTQLGLSGMTLNLALNSVLQIPKQEQGDTGLSLYFEKGHFRLLNESHEKKIREAVLAIHIEHKTLHIIEGLTAAHETPMMWRVRRQGEQQAYAKEIIQADPYVLKIIEQFDGVLIENSIKAVTAEH